MAVQEIQLEIQRQALANQNAVYESIPKYADGKLAVGDLMDLAQAADMSADDVQALVDAYHERQRLAADVAKAEACKSDGNDFEARKEQCYADHMAPAKRKYREAVGKVCDEENRWLKTQSAGDNAERRFRDHLKPQFLREAADEIREIYQAHCTESYQWRDHRRAVEIGLDDVTRRINDFRKELGGDKPTDGEKKELRKLENQRDDLRNQLDNIRATDCERERCRRLVRDAQNRLGELQYSHWPTPAEADAIVAELRAAVAE